MGGVSERPDTFFRVGPAELAKPECFAVKRGETQDTRCDIDYHHPQYKSLIDRISALPNTSTFAEIASMPLKSGFAAGKADRTDSLKDSVLQIRPTQILQDGELDLSGAYRIPAAEVALEHYLEFGEVLFNNTNSAALVGKSTVFREMGPAVCSNHITRIRLRGDIEPDFVAQVLSALGDAGYFARLCTNFNNQAGINTKTLATVRIPLPDAEKRMELLNSVTSAKKQRNTRLAEADALLAGIDEFVLEALGLTYNVPQQHIFATRIAEVRWSRVDADFHSLRFKIVRKAIESGAFPARSISEICTNIRSGFAAGRQDQAFDYDNGIPHLRPLNFDTFGQLSLSGTKFVPKEAVNIADRCLRGEVLLNNTNSTEMVGKSAVFDFEQPCFCSNHVTRLEPRNVVNPEYLAAVLNALRRLGYLGLLSTNFNNQAGINNATLSQLRVPYPPRWEQDRIATEVVRRRSKARQLRADAETGWEAAKRWFEEQLLGPAKAGSS